MTARAPLARRVDMLSGAKAPTKFFGALSEADDFVRELDTVRELQTRLAEVEAERDDLADRLMSIHEAHQITLSWLAKAERDLAKLATDRDNLRAQVSAGVR